MAVDPVLGAPAQPGADASLIEAISAAVVATDLDGRIFYVNAAAERLYGYPRAQLVGGHVMDLLVSAGDQNAASGIMERVLAGESWTGEFAVRSSGGGRVMVRITDSPLWRDGVVVGVVGVAEDVTDRQRARAEANVFADRVAQLARVTAELAGARDIATVTDVVVSHAADAVGAEVATLSLLGDDDSLSLVGFRGGDAELARRWATYALSADVPACDALRTGEPVVLGSRAETETRYPVLSGYPVEERSLVCLPLTVPEHPLGVITLAFPGPRIPDRQEMEFLTALADACAQALDRLKALADAEDAATKLSFLADASTELASSLDYRTTLANVARLAVPTLADWCAVEVLEDGELRTLAVQHVDPAKVAFAEQLQRRYPPDSASPTGSPNVVRTGVSELYPDITDEMLVAGARDDEHLRLARELHLRSALVVPLRARGNVLGAISLISAESGRRYGPADLTFAEDLARRAALAIDNSHLHSQTREAAVRLQRAVLPGRLGPVPGWEIAALYRPAGRTEVGGDFYDAIPLPDGRLAVVVGDVMGRGVQAAAAMAQMRSAIRAYIAIDPEPAAVLTKLDQMFTAYDMAQLVTLVYLVADPSSDHITAVNAGHLPPVLVRPGQPAQVVWLPPSLVLGAGDDDRSAVQFPFPGDATLLAFTDGLVERHGEDIDAGLEHLAGIAPMLADGPLAARLERLVETLPEDARSDDVTAVALRRRLPAL